MIENCVLLTDWLTDHVRGLNIDYKPWFGSTSKSNFFLNFIVDNFKINCEVLKMLFLKYFKISLFLNFEVIQNQHFKHFTIEKNVDFEVNYFKIEKYVDFEVLQNWEKVTRAMSS